MVDGGKPGDNSVGGGFAAQGIKAFATALGGDGKLAILDKGVFVTEVL